MTATNRRPEEHLLCLCARRAGLPSGFPLLSDAGASFDWTYFLTTADALGVTELLFDPLKAANVVVPDEILENLERRVVGATGSNLARTTQLAEILHLFKAHGIRAMTFKGPALAMGVYGHLGKRTSADLDILVHPRDVSRARPLLLANGYTLADRRRYRGGSLIYGLYPGAGRDDTLHPPRAELAALDVHVAFAYWVLGIRLETGRLFDRAVTVDVAGVPIKTLCPDDLLLVLSIHGMMHGWSHLRYVSDIDAVTARVDNWDSIVRHARSARMLRTLWVALLLARDLLSTPLPSHVVALAERDAEAVALTGNVTARLFDVVFRQQDWDPKPWFLAFQVRLRDKIRFHARSLVYEWFLKWPWDEWLGRRSASGTLKDA